MDPDSYFQELRRQIVGRDVRGRRLAGNSLIVYVDCEPGDATGFVLWFDPTWNLCDRERVLTGSRQAQHDEDSDDPDWGFNLAGEAVDVLVGKRIADLQMEPVTGDLRLDLEGGLTLTTFVSNPSTDHLWHIFEGTTGMNLYRAGAGWAGNSRGAEPATAASSSACRDLEAMDPDSYFQELQSQIVGRDVRWRHLAGNSLIVYIDCKPGDTTGFVIWFEPTWHLRDRERVLTGSRQAQDSEDPDDPSSGFCLTGEAVDALVGKRIAALQMEPVTGDLRLDLEGGLTLRTFVSDPLDDNLWHIHDCTTGLDLYREGTGWADDGESSES